MNALFVLIFTCGGALAIGRGLDLALWTDWNTGLCTAGSVWLRYGGLWAALVVGIIAARKLARQPLVLRSACRPVGVTSVLGGVCVGLAGAVRLAVGMTGVGALVRAVLELVCAVWLIRLGRSWTDKGEYRLPGRSMTPAVLGTAVFYWGVLSRFMENSSSWHRADCHGLADAGCAGVSFGDGPRPLAAGNVQRLPAVRGRDLHVPALLLLGTAPGAGAAVPWHHGSRPARGAVWLWHVLHRHAGAFHCGAGGRK